MSLEPSNLVYIGDDVYHSGGSLPRLLSILKYINDNAPLADEDQIYSDFVDAITDFEISFSYDKVLLITLINDDISLVASPEFSQVLTLMSYFYAVYDAKTSFELYFSVNVAPLLYYNMGESERVDFFGDQYNTVVADRSIVALETYVFSNGTYGSYNENDIKEMVSEHITDATELSLYEYFMRGYTYDVRLNILKKHTDTLNTLLSLFENTTNSLMIAVLSIFNTLGYGSQVLLLYVISLISEDSLKVLLNKTSWILSNTSELLATNKKKGTNPLFDRLATAQTLLELANSYNRVSYSILLRLKSFRAFVLSRLLINGDSKLFNGKSITDNDADLIVLKSNVDSQKLQYDDINNNVVSNGGNLTDSDKYALQHLIQDTFSSIGQTSSTLKSIQSSISGGNGEDTVTISDSFSWVSQKDFIGVTNNIRIDYKILPEFSILVSELIADHMKSYLSYLNSVYQDTQNFINVLIIDVTDVFNSVQDLSNSIQSLFQNITDLFYKDVMSKLLDSISSVLFLLQNLICALKSALCIVGEVLSVINFMVSLITKGIGLLESMADPDTDVDNLLNDLANNYFNSFRTLYQQLTESFQNMLIASQVNDVFNILGDADKAKEFAQASMDAFLDCLNNISESLDTIVQNAVEDALYNIKINMQNQLDVILSSRQSITDCGLPTTISEFGSVFPISNSSLDIGTPNGSPKDVSCQ